jgi:creatinine amidohydrolase
MPDKVLMEHMSWQEIEEAIGAGKTTAILNAGAIEQHGPHLPIVTDTLIGQAVAERAARELGNALVAPVVRPACSAHHLGFPGTLTLEYMTFVDVLIQLVRNLADAGFKNIALMSSHGGNIDIMVAFAPTIAKSVQGKASVFMISSLDLYFKKAQEVLEAEGISRPRAGVHAGYGETSMMLYLAPELVDMGRAGPGLTDEAFYQPENLKRSQLASFTYGLKSQTANGVLGDPTGANAEVGKRLVDLQVQAVVEAIRSYVQG